MHSSHLSLVMLSNMWLLEPAMLPLTQAFYTYFLCLEHLPAL